MSTLTAISKRPVCLSSVRSAADATGSRASPPPLQPAAIRMKSSAPARLQRTKLERPREGLGYGPRVKVGIVVPYSWSFWGGVVDHAEQQLLALRKLGVDAWLVMGNDPPGSFTHVLHPGLGRHTDPPPHVLPVGRSVIVPANGSLPNIVLSPSTPLRIKRIFERERFDLIHVHEPMTPAIGVAAVALWRGPTVATFHASGELGWLRFGRYTWGNVLAARIDRRIAVSEQARASAERWLPGEYVVVRHGRSSRSVTPGTASPGACSRSIRMRQREGFRSPFAVAADCVDPRRRRSGRRGDLVARALVVRRVGRVHRRPLALGLRGDRTQPAVGCRTGFRVADGDRASSAAAAARLPARVRCVLRRALRECRSPRPDRRARARRGAQSAGARPTRSLGDARRDGFRPPCLRSRAGAGADRVRPLDGEDSAVGGDEPCSRRRRRRRTPRVRVREREGPQPLAA